MLVGHWRGKKGHGFGESLAGSCLGNRASERSTSAGVHGVDIAPFGRGTHDGSASNERIDRIESNMAPYRNAAESPRPSRASSFVVRIIIDADVRHADDVTRPKGGICERVKSNLPGGSIDRFPPNKKGPADQLTLTKYLYKK